MWHARWLVICGLLASTRARADEVTLRLDAPGAAYAGDDHWIQLVGGGASLRRGAVEGELAADYWINPCVRGINLTARGGFAPALVDRPGGRWTVRVPVLLGASLAPLSGGGCDQNPGVQLYALTISAGFELVRWGAHKGFSLRALGYAGEQSWERGALSTDPQREWRALYGVTASIGIALR